MEVNIIKDIYFDIQGFLRDKFKGQELIKLVRRDQVVFYMENGVYPLWNELGYDKKIIYVFLKEPTLRLFGKWRNIDTKWKNEESNK